MRVYPTGGVPGNKGWWLANARLLSTSPPSRLPHLSRFRRVGISLIRDTPLEPFLKIISLTCDSQPDALPVLISSRGLVDLTVDGPVFWIYSFLLHYAQTIPAFHRRSNPCLSHPTYAMPSPAS
jgi:hypothetical protein